MTPEQFRELADSLRLECLLCEGRGCSECGMEGRTLGSKEAALIEHCLELRAALGRWLNVRQLIKNGRVEPETAAELHNDTRILIGADE